MVRPKIEDQVKNAVRSYLLTAETLSAQEAPLNTLSVSTRLGFNRKTLKKYGLDEEIAKAAERQSHNGVSSPKELERRSYAELVRERDDVIDEMKRRCEALLERICLAEGNAQRLGIDPQELWKPLPMPNRSVPYIGSRTRVRGRN